MPMLINILLVAGGGAVGAASRFLLAGAVQRFMAGEHVQFPFGTLSVNLIGCLLIGLGAAFFAGATAPREEWRLLLLVGVMGGFTTFSTFGLETFELLHQKQWLTAAGYVIASNLGGVVAVFIGYRMIQPM